MADQKKKRAYAAQAYEFGANTVPPSNAAPASIPGLGMPAQGMGMGMPQSPPDPLAGQFGQMNLGPQPVQQVTPQMQQQPATTTHLNQLFPSDLISQVPQTADSSSGLMLTRPRSHSMSRSLTCLPRPCK
jgi:protein transport protein SEC24